MRAKLLSLYALSFSLILGAVFLLHPSSVAAVSGGDWRSDRIIDDSVFYNPNTMSSDDIQSFLNSKVPVCDTNGTQPYNGTTRAAYSISRGHPPPFICLKDFSQSVPTMPADAYCGAISGGSMSAATIIKAVSAACSINPQALLVLLQKEQTLVTDDWPWPIQYQSATGYGCPDTASCDQNYAGFFNQVYYGARQYQKYAKQPQNYNYSAGKNSFVGYNPNSGCGGTNITMSNQATAGLYNYTPYQPNQSALNNLYGSGDSCGAYGNRNFWRMYWDWFGNPIGAEYAWLIENFSYSGGDNLLAQGYPESITLKARNVSRHPWYNHGANPVRLGTWQPANRASALLSGGNRYATMQEGVVNPNEIATFTFQVTAQSLGSFVEPMNLVAENAAWMSWPGFSPTINVASPYQWQIDDVIYGDGTGVMNPGSTQLITVKARNTGNVTWSKTSGPPVRLATWTPGRASSVSSGWINSTRVADMNETSVAPGQVAGFQFYVKMPSGGNYYEKLNLVAEGQNWFNEAGLTLYLHGRTYSWQPVWQSLSTGNPNIGRNQTFDITVKVHNDGEMPWKKTDPFRVRLGTSSPLNRGSAFYQPSWINDTRPADLVENVVLPGQDGTFTFNARTPNTPGQWYEHFDMVAEGIQWLNDPGFNVYVNVK